MCHRHISFCIQWQRCDGACPTTLTWLIQTNRSQHFATLWIYRTDSRLAPSEWETSLQSNAVSHWLDANIESALIYHNNKTSAMGPYWIFWCWKWILWPWLYIEGGFTIKMWNEPKTDDLSDFGIFGGYLGRHFGWCPKVPRGHHVDPDFTWPHLST